jgi:putative addiction module component (TIGR02574 family)
MTREQIKSAALSLDPAEREALAEELLLSLSDLDQAEIDAAWLGEAHRRDADYATGKTTAKPVDEVLARLRAKARR